ncbi:MAG: DNA primase [Candidatus Sumerlaeaceae bacterium]|nr:DNA primase [Candidatus Sumerlaeaceae bacterium]
MSRILEFANRLRAQIDIVQVVQEHVPLKRVGINLKGLCPFHKEKTPSFSVNAAKQIFHCFGCGKGGDVIRFVQEIERLDWMGAVRFLAERHGIPMPSFGQEGRSAVTRSERDRQHQLTREAAAFFARQLAAAMQDPASEIARYMERRQIPMELAAHFALGLAPDQWTGLLDHVTATGYEREFVASAGLAIHNQDKGRFYDRFRKRLIFTICDGLGRPVAFGGRVYASDAAPDEPKYINSPETALYRKGEHLYALHLAKERIVAEQRALLMEGYMDVLRAHQHGFTHAVATCGTALTDEQARTLKKFAREIVFVYDGDAAGQAAMLRGTEILLEHELAVRIVVLPDNHDPDSYLLTHGAQAFQAALEAATDFLTFFLEVASARHNRHTTEGRVQIVEFVVPLLQKVKNPIMRRDLVCRTADFLSIDDSLIDRQLERRTRRRAEELRQEIGEATSAASRLEAQMLRLVVESRVARPLVLRGLNPEWILNGNLRRWFEFVREAATEENLSWDTLLAACRDEEERAMLTAIAMDEETLPECEQAISHLLARLRMRYSRHQAAQVARQLSDEYRRDPDAIACSTLIQELDEHARTVSHLSRKVFKPRPDKKAVPR